MNFLGILRADLWLWDLYMNNASGITRVDFITDSFVLIPSIITTILISISSILLLLGSIQTKRRSYKLKTLRNISIISGAFILFAEILWLIMVPLFFPMTSYWDWFLSAYSTPYTFWSIPLLFFSYPLHQAGFGIIGGFLAMGLAFGGAGVAGYHSKERAIKIPEKMRTTPDKD
jgi:hypothetical protein